MVRARRPGLPTEEAVPAGHRQGHRPPDVGELVNRAERGAAGLPDQDAARKPLADHLTAFGAAVRAGLASRSKTKRVPSERQAAVTVQRVRDALAGCRFEAVADLRPGAERKLSEYLRGRTRLQRTDGGLSQQTAAFVLAAVRRFVWWLAERANAPVRASLLDDVPGFDPKNDRTHARREIGPADLAAVLQAARGSAEVFRGLTGADRYFLYLVAFATGFRAEELTRLSPACFALDTSPPTATIPGRFTKNKKAAVQPLPGGVAAQLRPYIAGKPADRPLWPPVWHQAAAKMLRIDLAAAGVPYRLETPDGPRFADFHALRHSFVSSLAAAGVGVKELQELARHSTPALTLGVYSHARPEALAASVGRLQLPSAEVDPVARMTREELEAAVRTLAAVTLGMWAVVSGADPFPVAPRVAPPDAIRGDSGELIETGERLRPAG